MRYQVLLGCGWIALSLVWASCSGRGSSTAPIPKAVIVSPKVQKIEPPVREASRKNIELQGYAAGLREDAEAARTLSNKAATETKRMARSGAVTTSDLLNLYETMKTASDRSSSLVARLGKLEHTIRLQDQALQEGLQATNMAMQSAAEGDAISKVLEQQGHSLTENYNRASNEARKLAEKEAVQRSRIRLLLMWSGAATALVIGYLYFKFKSPI